mgnify:FL=1
MFARGIKRVRTSSGLALYYFDMHHFYGDAVERLFKIGGKDVAVSEVEYLESKTDYYLEKYVGLLEDAVDAEPQ